MMAAMTVCDVLQQELKELRTNARHEVLTNIRAQREIYEKLTRHEQRLTCIEKQLKTLIVQDEARERDAKLWNPSLLMMIITFVILQVLWTFLKS